MYLLPYGGSGFWILLTLGIFVALAVYGIIMGILSVTRAKAPVWSEVKPDLSRAAAPAPTRLPVFRDEAATGVAWVHHDPRTGEVLGDHHLTTVFRGV